MDAEASVEIWNRAVVARGGPAPRAGDTALSSAMAFHNMVMSGGFDHAFDVLTPDQIAEASNGYRYLKFDSVAELIDRVPAALDAALDDQIEELEARYAALVPQDQTLADHFEAALRERPEDFAPVA